LCSGFCRDCREGNKYLVAWYWLACGHLIPPSSLAEEKEPLVVRGDNTVIDQANELGGTDNISLVVVEVDII
jgi:hypothetical protein